MASSARDLRVVAHCERERSRVLFEAIEKHPHFRHVARENLVHEIELLLGRQPIVHQMADVSAIRGLHVGIRRAACRRHRYRREEAQQLGARPTARNLARTAGLKVTLEDRPCGTPERRLRGEAVDDRDVLEDLAHPIAIRLRVTLAQDLREAFRVRRRMTRPNQRPDDLGRCALRGFRVQRVAAEEVNLLELREETRTGIAARRPLHLLDGQRFTGIYAVGVELVPAVEMPRNQQDIATDALPARGGEPIRATSLDKLDEIELIGRHAALEHFALVGRVDGDRANRPLVGARIQCKRAGENERQQDELRKPGHLRTAGGRKTAQVLHVRRQRGNRPTVEW
jgi:hypothetical protein